MNISTDQTTIESVTLEVSDLATATAFYDAAFDLGDKLHIRATDAPTNGFRGYILSLVVSQPSTVDSLIGSALDAGAATIKPAKKSFWGYGGVIQAPDGAIWKVATSAKKDTGPATRAIDDFVVLLGVDKVKATKQFYVDRGLTVGKSFGSKYVEFEAPASSVKLALYGRKAAAKDAGVDPEGAGSHRIVLGSGIGPCADPDGFVWEAGR
ncbi:glyoxalase [Nocardia sp. NPDC046473]|uniref:glyoxalase n=1 Tax=Nocardia sp. NPDC046473 TaxID=3155733 RepID=UPI0033D7706C